MKIAAAIVTDRGGRTCHAAIVARELGIPAVVGADGRHDGAEDRRRGHGLLRRRRDRPRLRRRAAVRRPTRVDAERAAAAAHRDHAQSRQSRSSRSERPMLPNDGVGLARMEFIISEHIGVHPMALVSPEKVDLGEARRAIERAGPQTTHARRITSSSARPRASARSPRRSIPSP